MSRYAFQWAKREPAPNAAAKVALLLLGDLAEGSKHAGRVGIGELGRLFPADEETIRNALSDLEAAQLIKFDLKQTTPKHVRVSFQVLVPDGWRSPVGGQTAVKAEGSDPIPTAVYRFFDTDGVLLYVGVADDPAGRFADHSRDKSWWVEVVTREVHWYPDRETALTEEDRAIAAELPKHNIKRMPPPDGPSPRRQYVVPGSNYYKARALAEKILNDIQRGSFDREPVPEAKDLAWRYATNEIIAEAAAKILVRGGYVHLVANRLVLGPGGRWGWTY